MNNNLKSKPQYYSMRIDYVTGEFDDFKVINHVYSTDNKIIYITKMDNRIIEAFTENIQKIEYDKEFTKLLLSNKKAKDKIENNKNLEKIEGK